MRTTNIRWILISAITALSFSALPAMAHEGAEPRTGHRDPAALVKHFDRNGDGKLQLTELPDRMKARLAPADTNGDGVLTAEELTARHEAQKAARKAAMDTDHDGQVSQTERDAFRTEKQKEHFAKMDKDGDGQISQAEAGRFWSRLSVADTDASGTVTYAEMSQAIATGTLQPMHHHGHRPPSESNTKS
jgi:Ca2+-binding EF-hand superfamily protein